MTEDALIQHRLRELEEFATGARQVERDVDTLKVTVAAMDKTLAEIQTEMRLDAGKVSSSLARLHQRLDEAMTAKARDEGREAGRAEASTRTWKVIAWTVGATTSFGLLVVALLNLVTN